MNLLHPSQSSRHLPHWLPDRQPQLTLHRLLHLRTDRQRLDLQRQKKNPWKVLLPIRNLQSRMIRWERLLLLFLCDFHSFSFPLSCSVNAQSVSFVLTVEKNPAVPCITGRRRTRRFRLRWSGRWRRRKFPKMLLLFYWSLSQFRQTRNEQSLCDVPNFNGYNCCYCNHYCSLQPIADFEIEIKISVRSF